MVQIGRRVQSNYFKMIIRNRFYANNTCFFKNEVSRTPMWTRDFLAPYHNIQIINRRLQPKRSHLLFLIDHNIQIINRRLQHLEPIYFPFLIITYKSLTGEYSYIHNVPSTLNIITHNSLVEMNIKDTPSYSENLRRFVARLLIWLQLCFDAWLVNPFLNINDCIY